MKLIDTHAHVFSQQDEFSPTARYLPEYSVTAEDYIAQLDQYGLDYGVLIQPSFLGTNNKYMLAAIAKYPTRLKGIAVVESTISEQEIQSLTKNGIIGIRLNLFGTPCPDLTEITWQHFLQRLEKQPWQVELHAPPSYLIQLLPPLSHYKLPVVIDHFGRIDPKKGIADNDCQTFLQLLNPNQHWVKVSGYYLLGKNDPINTAKSVLQILLDKGMSDNLVWGSDWPHTQYESQLSFDTAFNSFQQITGDKALANKILGENGIKLFGF